MGTEWCKKQALRFVIVAAFATLAFPTGIRAWGKEGHEIVAAIAEAHLTPEARGSIDQLLLVEPGATMESVASWADEIRDRSSARWHFVNFPPGDCNYRPPIECRDGECLVAAFDRERSILADQRLPIEEREQALKFVIHLAGDAEQPLHAWGPDGGGNSYQVQFNGYGTNIHHVWDTELVRMYAIEDGSWNGRPNYKALTSELISYSNQLTISDDQEPIDWVESSCRIAQNRSIYPPRTVPTTYPDQWRTVVELQLIEAGMHLASVLNTTFKK